MSYFGAELKDVYLKPMAEFAILFIGTHLYGVFAGRYTFAKDWKIVLSLGFCVCLILSGIACFLHIYFFDTTLIPHLYMGSRVSLWFFMYLDCLRYIYPWFGVFYIIGLIRANFKIIKRQSETDITLQLAQLENLKN